MLNLEQIKVVSFDLDDTLWDCASAIASAEVVLSNWIEKNAPKLSDIASKQTLVEIRQKTVIAQPELMNDVSALRQQVLQVYLAQGGYGAAVAEEAFDVFYRARSSVTLYEGVHELLSALKAHFKIAAITNGNADLEIVGIAHYFDDIQHATLNNAPKPDAQMFEVCLGNLNLGKQNMLHVGDNPEADVQGGHNAGVATAWFNPHNDYWPAQLREPTIAVSSLRELQETLVA